jgi:DNA-binding beta-propeller fold protein YncE
MILSRRCIAYLAVIAAAWSATDRAFAQTPTPALQLESKIPLGDVSGRIDHLAVDLSRKRLFVAELGNDTVAVVDLAEGKVRNVIGGLSEPQGVGYEPTMDALYVANGRDGSVRIYRGPDYAPSGRIELGDDADNIRVDRVANQVVVGYGSGALAVIDANTFRKIADIPLPAHPESFQLEPGTPRIYVNLPAAGAIVVADRLSGQQIARWPTEVARGNFAMALRPKAAEVLAAFRDPAKLGMFASKDGAHIASLDICGDVDDLFVDQKRDRVYLSCGEGSTDVLEAKGSGYDRVARIPTVPGARTSLFVPELDRFFLAVRAAEAAPASIWVFRPMP